MSEIYESDQHYETIAVEDLDIVRLGRQGENDTQQVSIDCSAWLTELPGAELIVAARRYGEKAIYLPTVTTADGVVTWRSLAQDTAVAGWGQAEIRAQVDGKIKKSKVFRTYVEKALAGPGAPAEVLPDWVTEIRTSVAGIQSAVSESQSAATSAGENATAAAESAAAAAETAATAKAQVEDLGLTSIAAYERHPGYYTSGASPKWTSTSMTDERYRHILVPLAAGDTFELVAGAKNLYWGVLKDYHPENTEAGGAAADMATGFETRQTTNANSESGEKTAPADAKYLYVTVRWGKDTQTGEFIDTTPASLVINGWEYADTAREAVGKIREELAADQTQLDGLQEQIDTAGLFSYGAPEGLNWVKGSLGSTGNYSSATNTIRMNGAVFLPAGSTVTMQDGYMLRAYLYTSGTDISSFTERKAWGTSFTAEEDVYLRLLVSDAAHYNDNTYDIGDTSCQSQVIWRVLQSTIRQDVTALQEAAAAIPDKAEGGYVDITWQLAGDGNISTPAVGSVISLTPDRENNVYSFLTKAVKAGDRYRVTGSGGSEARLWAFADGNLTVLSRSNTYVNAEALELTAEADGYLILNFVTGTGKLTPSVEIRISRADQYAEEDALRTAYLMRQSGPNVLTAFSDIVCCGDSLTRSVVYTGVDGQGGNVTRMARRPWPELLGVKTGAHTSFLAFGGYDAKTWWTNYGSQIAAADNQLAIVYLGTNGSLTDTVDTDAPGTDKEGYDVTTNTGAYCKIVKSWLDVGARVLLVHVKKTTDSIWTTNAVIDKIAEKFGVAVVDVPLLPDAKYHSWPDGTGLNTVHYNDLGYAAFLEVLLRSVGNLGDTMMKRLIPA